MDRPRKYEGVGKDPGHAMNATGDIIRAARIYEVILEGETSRCRDPNSDLEDEL